MPTYEYRCDRCRLVTERFDKMTSHPTVIPCGACAGRATKIISAGAYACVTPAWEAYESNRLPKNLPRELVPKQRDGKAWITSQRHEDRVLKTIGFERE